MEDQVPDDKEDRYAEFNYDQLEEIIDMAGSDFAAKMGFPSWC